MNTATQSVPETCCLNCVFFRDDNVRGDPLPSASQQLRDSLRQTSASVTANLRCYKEFWGPKSVAGAIEAGLMQLLKKDRQTSCLFFPYEAELSPAAASRLQEKMEKRREARHSRLFDLLKILFGAVIGAVVAWIASRLLSH